MEAHGEATRTPAQQFIYELMKESAVQVVDPQGMDSYIKACNSALFNILLEQWSPLHEVLISAYETRAKSGADLSPVHANRLIVRSLQREILSRPTEYTYPEQFENPEAWSSFVTRVLSDEEMRGRFSYDLANRDVQTNIANRGASLKLLALLTNERWGKGGLRILEIGCGQNQVLKKLVLNSVQGGMLGFRYQDIEVKEKPGAYLQESKLVDDAEMSKLINTLLRAGHVAVQSALGIDKVPPATDNDALALAWVRSQFYPSESLNRQRIEEAILLDEAQPANVGFVEHDITKTDPSKLEEILAQGPFDIVVFGTMLYQLDDEGRSVAEQLANKTVSPEHGIIVYQDFIDVDPHDPTKLTLCKWTPFQYRTIIEDMRDPKRRKQVLFVWEGGRCRKMLVGEAELSKEQGTIQAHDLLVSCASSLRPSQ